MRTKSTNIEKIIERVNGSMSIEGMPLSNEDKARIRRYAGNAESYTEIRRELIEKHTVRMGANDEQ